MKTALTIACTLTLALTLSACRRASESMAERVIEKAMQAQGGGQADVDLSEGRMVIQNKDGKSEIATGGSAAVPADFPKDILVYDGAKIVVSAKHQDGFMLSLQTPDKREKVVEKYRASMTAQGWSEESSLNAGEVTVVAYKKEGRSASLSVAGSGDETQITLTAATEKNL